MGLNYKTKLILGIFIFALTLFFPAKVFSDDEIHQQKLTPMNPEKSALVKKAMQRFPKPTLPGVDLSWHIDRSMEYINGVVDRRRDYIPFYCNFVYFDPVRLQHAQWDVPHCVGRFVDIMMMWENSFNTRVKDEEVLQGLRRLLHGSISSEDNLAHFPNYCRETAEVDWHSQREVLLSLLGLYKSRSDNESMVLAKKLIEGYNKHSSKPGFPVNTMWSGRFIEALLDYHRINKEPLALEMAQQFADDFHDRFFDDKGTFPTPGNNQSTLQAVGELIEFGIYTNQAKYVLKGKKIIDTGLWKVRSSYGFIFESEGPRGELNCCGDLIKAEIMLGLNGYPEYFDDAERILRNHTLASQYLDPAFWGFKTGRVFLNNETPDYYLDPPAAQGTPTDQVQQTEDSATATANRKVIYFEDNDKELYTDAGVLALGGFAFTLANDLIDPDIGGLDVPADMVGGVTHGLIEAWNHIVTKDDNGFHVNFLLSKITPEIEIYSFIPVEGRIALKINKPIDVYVRIPKYVNKKQLSLTVNGKEMLNRMIGSYLLIRSQEKACVAEIKFPQQVSTTQEAIAGVTYQIEWLGDTVWNITPPGKHVPLYYPERLVLCGVASEDHDRLIGER